MKGLKCTDQTKMMSIALFTVYFLYGMFKIPLDQYVGSLAVGAVIYAATLTIEYSVGAVLLTNFILLMIPSSKEGFAVDPKIEEKVTAAAAPEAEPAAEEEVPDESEKPVVSGVDSPSVAEVESVGTGVTFTGSSTPASAKAKPSTAKQISEKGIPPANQPADLVSDGFDNKKGSGSGLFKLGQIPTDEKGGFHIDAGTSVLNALKSLKPDQISAMTQDTKQLIETQKTLMGMLQSFKPMMSEGKEMMETFQQMFSPAGGSAMGALQAAQDTLKS